MRELPEPDGYIGANDLDPNAGTEGWSRDQVLAIQKQAYEDGLRDAPSGYMLVPIEPTEEMLCAGDDVLREAFRDRCIATWTIYEAMLTASQKEQK